MMFVPIHVKMVKKEPLWYDFLHAFSIISVTIEAIDIIFVWNKVWNKKIDNYFYFNWGKSELRNLKVRLLRSYRYCERDFFISVIINYYKYLYCHSF